MENLPKRDNGYIRWNESVGCEIPFVYDEIKGVLYIKEYVNNENITLYYSENGKCLSFTGGHIKEAKIGVILGKYKKDYMYNSGDIIKDLKRDITVIEIIKKNRKYKCLCNKDGYVWNINKNSLESNIGCPVCAGQLVKTGINDICSTDPWILDLGVDKNSASEVSKCSVKNVLCRCPYCKKEFYKSAQSIYANKSISCTCGDGYSYPEKFLYSTLKQLNIPFFTQANKNILNWCGGFKYDFYIPSFNTIIETHGLQHYKQTGFKKELSEIIKNDEIKKDKALNNNIKNYIVIDCRESKLNWIKNNILNSHLNNMFDLSQINWLKCEEFALGNLVKEVCDYWINKQEVESTSDLSNIFDIERATVIKYLKKGNELGWCVYNPEEEKLKASKKLNKANGKPIDVFKPNGEYISTYKNARDLERKSIEDFGFDLDYRGISQVCRGTRNVYKGLVFRFNN
ncbi:hypothetical protein [Clostridium sp.]|uniref:hypothetical protein n=1 Tax=Clostridium sp. TaxID=1506 RepID=UPI002914FF1A|nr:hypothetical protein [Clostridium sp.]MDU3410160.1 hypothetical protein [Clostridium sp.]